MAGYGIGFQPGADQNGEGRRGGSPVQEAIKLLSLRLPSRVSPSAIAPQSLLTSPGGAGMATGNMTLEAALELLRKLMQQSGAAPPPQMPSPASPFQAPQAQPLMASPAMQRSVFTVPTAGEDRDRGISRPVPQPEQRVPGSGIPSPPPSAPQPAPPSYEPPPSWPGPPSIVVDEDRESAPVPEPDQEPIFDAPPRGRFHWQ